MGGPLIIQKLHLSILRLVKIIFYSASEKDVQDDYVKSNTFEQVYSSKPSKPTQQISIDNRLR